MSKIFGYAEDSLTLWALNKCIPDILRQLGDQSNPTDCIAFYRPSFGRGGRGHEAKFGEFDSILASLDNLYLIESKRDKNEGRIVLDKEQIQRHKIFAWYYEKWNAHNWDDFISSNSVRDDFINHFPNKKLAPSGSKLAVNLEYVLNILQKHLHGNVTPKNVLLHFFDGEKSRKIEKVDGEEQFMIVNIDYSQHILNNFIRFF